MVRDIVKRMLNRNVIGIKQIGKGASSCVYEVKLDGPPVRIAVKVSDYPELIREEYEQIRFISDRVDCKLPHLYFFHEEAGKAYLGMERLDGVEGGEKVLRFRRNRRKLVNEIVDNLIRIHSVHNETFGPIHDAHWETWASYYLEFAKELYDFIMSDDTPAPAVVKTAAEKAFSVLDTVLGTCENVPTLTHGDYWMPNFIIDPKTVSLCGVVDPFQVMWSEPEYELFALTAGYGRKLHLYETYKKKVKVTEYCDYKVAMYALFNELNWYKKTGTISFEFLEELSRRLLKAHEKEDFS